MYKKLMSVAAAILLACAIAYGHAPNQISYKIKQTGAVAMLTVRLTAAGAIDLATSLNPALAGQAVVKLNKHYGDFTRYFNRTISLSIDGVPACLTFVKGDLASHEAVMVFRLDRRISAYSVVKARITSFHGIYQRAIHHVTVIAGANRYYCVQHRSNPACTFNLAKASPVVAQAHGHQGLGAWYFGAGLLLLHILAFFFVVVPRLAGKLPARPAAATGL